MLHRKKSSFRRARSGHTFKEPNLLFTAAMENEKSRSDQLEERLIEFAYASYDSRQNYRRRLPDDTLRSRSCGLELLRHLIMLKREALKAARTSYTNWG